MKTYIRLTMMIFTIVMMTACGVTEDLGRKCGGDLKELCHNVFGGRADSEQDDTLDHHQDEIDAIRDRVSILENQNASLLTLISGNATSIANLNSQVGIINTTLTTVATQGDLAAATASLQSQVDAINLILPTLNDQAAIAALQAQVTAMNNAMALLASTSDLNLVQSGLQSQIDVLDGRVDVLEGQIGTPVTGLQAIVTQNTIEIMNLMSNHNVTKIVDPCGDTPGKYDEIFFRTSTGKIIASFSDNANGLNTRFSEIPVGSYSTTDGTGCTFSVVSGVGGLSVVSNGPNPTIEY